MQLYLISYPQFLKDETNLVKDILEMYPLVFHLRKPRACVSEYEAFLKAIPPQLHSRIMLHDAFELVSDFELRGLHFSTSKRKEAKNYTDGFKSTSCHSLDEVQAVEKNFDACFLSPVFPSISKPGYFGELNLEEVERYLKTSREITVNALGGLDVGNINKVAQMGFDGAAMLGAVWGKNPEKNEVCKRLKQIMRWKQNVPTA